MAKRQKYPLLRLRSDNYKIAEQQRIPGERRIIAGKLNIDRECFKKSNEEKLKLKVAKLSANQ